jgi:phospholipid/cholesterol/gamma-HCH transport system substrate-binding protein
MKNEIRRDVMLGLFVSIGIVLFIVGIFLIGSKSEMFSKTFQVSAIFKNASGLKKGGNVRFNGVKVGIVKEVNLINDSTVQVDMKIEEEKHKFITKNAIAEIASDGLMGDKLIYIVNGPGGAPLVANNDFIQSKMPLNTDDMLATLNVSNNNIKIISQNLRTLTDDLNDKKGSLNILLKDSTIAPNVKQSVNNLRLMSQDVMKAGADIQRITYKMEHGKGSVAEILNDTAMAKNLARTVDKLKSASDKLNNASEQAKITMDHINSGDGTINQLLTDPKLSSDLKQSVVNIKNASDNLNQNMEALKHSFLLRGYFRKQEKKK